MMKFTPNDISRLEKSGDIKPFGNNIAYVRTHIITKIITKEENTDSLEAKAKSMNAVSVQIIAAPQKVLNAIFQTEVEALEFAKSL